MKPAKYIVAVAVLLAASPLSAKEWDIDHGKSSLTFSAVQDGAPFEGKFTSFVAGVNLDLDHPENGRISARVEIRDIFTGDNQRDAFLPATEWFDRGHYPFATFSSSHIEWDRNPAEPMLKENIGCYRAFGTLTMKGTSQDVVMPFCVVPQGDGVHARGKFTIMRNDFKIGEKEFAGEDTVKYKVDVVIDIIAR